MSNQEQRAALPNSPGALASDGTTLLIADRGGSILWWRWLGAAGQPIKAHGDGGPAVASTSWFATSGGWEPEIKRWEPGAAQAQWAVRPFTGRVTALCAQGELLFGAGANKPLPAATPTSNKDRAPLLPGEVVAIARDGRISRVAIQASGSISALACGGDWIAAIDEGAPGKLRLRAGNKSLDVALGSQPITAIATQGDTLLAANAEGIWDVSPQSGTHRLHFKLAAGAPRVLSLLAIGKHLFAATSEGVLRWPQGKPWMHGTSQPTALSRHGNALLVWWEDGELVQYDPQSGRVLATQTVMRLP